MPRPRLAAFGLGLALALCVAADLVRMPVQVHDALFELLDARQSPSVAASFTGSAHTSAYLRPLRIAQIKALFDLAGGTHYQAAYRGFHALLLIATLLLFVGALRVTTAVDAGAAAFALLVVLGLHTFRGTVQEAFPINHFLEIVLFCLLALRLARSRGGLLVDVAAVATLVSASLTLESGLLVWVVAVAAWAVGWRGISAAAVAVMTAVLAAYLYVRFVYLATGTPGLTERSSGYLFEVVDRFDLQRRFGAHPGRFYAYNVATSVLSVLFSEPRAGVFVAVKQWLDNTLTARTVLHLSTSIATTGLLLTTAVSTLRQRLLDDTARMLIVFAILLGANAVLSYAYTKDEIITVAGVCYALAAFAAIRSLLQRAATRPRGGAVVVALLVVLAAGWGVRAANLHYILRAQAFRHQNDWADLPEQWRRDGTLPADPGARTLLQQLRRDAVTMRIPNPRVDNPAWIEALWED